MVGKKNTVVQRYEGGSRTFRFRESVDEHLRRRIDRCQNASIDYCREEAAHHDWSVRKVRYNQYWRARKGARRKPCSRRSAGAYRSNMVPMRGTHRQGRAATGKEPVRGREERRRSVAAEHPVPARRRMAPERGDASGFPLNSGRRPWEETSTILPQRFLRRPRAALQEASDLLAQHLTTRDAAGADLPTPVQPGHDQPVSARLPAAVSPEAGDHAGERGAFFHRSRATTVILRGIS